MPIHDQGYRRYAGRRAPRGRAWAVITRAGLRTLLRKRVFLGLLLVSWFQFVVRAVQIYIAANFAQAALLAPTVETFRDFFDRQDIFVFIVSVYAGAGLIANDRRANALQIYLSKPLTRGEYVFGKLGVLMTLLLLITWVPGVVLLLVQVLFAGNFTFVRANAFLLPAMTVFSIVEVVTVSTAMLALSSLSNSSRFVGIMYTALIFFTDALFGVLRVVTGSTGLSWIAVGKDVAQVGDAVFRVPLRYETPWLASLLAVALVVVGSAVVLARRVRGVEVVA
jgi:ABC-2 type transport system permease protein